MAQIVNRSRPPIRETFWLVGPPASLREVPTLCEVGTGRANDIGDETGGR